MLRTKLGRSLWHHYVIVLRFQRDADVLVGRRQRGKEAGLKSAWNKYEREASILAYLPEVTKIAKRLRHMFPSHIELHDLEQSGIVGLCTAAKRYKPIRGPFPPMAYFYVRGAIIDAHKRRAYREATMDSIQAIAESNDGWLPAELEGVDKAPLADEQAERSQMSAKVQECIRYLDPASQELLIRLMQGESFAQMARGIGRSDKNVKELLARAKDELRAVLETEGITE